MIGMNRETGKPLKSYEHLKQSIADILSTPIGSRVMRRDYGSRLFELVDAPLNQNTLVDIYAAVGEALGRWEPRFKLTRVKVTSIIDGVVRLELEGEYLPDGNLITLEDILV